ncbi:prephenate dehydratase [Zavarzinia sp. CC-PAN008]|uniref:prephenate dehydratase n=1 Tax=Zavarzinia sp. CC-PAN008 TaxID=3243332 RepID=UPI003F7477CC
MTTVTHPRVAFQGEPGAYSHLAIREAMPQAEALPCPTFEDAFAAVAEGRADLGMIPIENSLAGRVADIHHLMPESGLFIIGEHFQRVRHQLLARPEATLAGLKTVTSHQMALAQCRNIIRSQGLRAVQHADTAGAARDVSLGTDVTVAAIASSLAAEVYGLKILVPDVEDADHNTTRFVVLAREGADPGPDSGPTVTSFVFRVRNVPAALYKALGGFATNGVNLTKLESYQLDGTFTATQFYADAEGHPSQRPLALALEELDFFCSYWKVLGTYPASPFRHGVVQGA